MNLKKKIIAANWKMNKTLPEGEKLRNQVLEGLKKIPHNAEPILFPSFLHIGNWQNLYNTTPNPPIALGAQNLGTEPNGARTGEISAHMLKSAHVEYVLIGHAERRTFYHEDNNSLILQKLQQAQQHNLKTIFCCGESLEIRKSKKTLEHLQKQLEPLKNLNNIHNPNILIAYEPVWAIGTGLIPDVKEIQNINTQIRKILHEIYLLPKPYLPFLYGGSVNEKNAQDILTHVDGLLVGSSSLHAEKFLQILAATQHKT
ncbi:MAG: triose-phosphate isomerase [Cytophagales bacterium]|nr:triose-phosphate isomerase [Cytophagales bacterium]